MSNIRLQGSDLEFISQIKRNGTGTSKVSKSYLKLMQDEWFDLLVLSITERTYVARNFNSFVVRVKPREDINFPLTFNSLNDIESFYIKNILKQ